MTFKEFKRRFLNRGLIDREILLMGCILFPAWTLYWCATNFNWQSILSVYIMMILGGLHISVFVHRCWSHKAWKPVRLLNLYGLFIHTIGMFTTSIMWAGTHRKHHHLEDTDRDPHSPYYMPRWKIILYPRISAATEIQYTKDLFNDKDHAFFHRYYYHINITLWILLYAISPATLGFWFACVGAWGIKQRLINTIGHNDPVNKSTCNRPIWAYIYLDGEPWHDNHSKDPGNWRIGHHWWQVDLGQYCIWAFEKLGWATITQQKWKKSY